MIIYNNNREFIGIDEENLKSLGYPNFTSLLSEAADFADLFVKVPGHVHNFKHVHWLDFILCATDKSSSKAIIHANGKSFSCVLDVKTIYLTSSPTKQSYNISLNNLRALSAEELQNISGELQSRPAPVAAPVTPKPVTEPEPTEEEEVEIQTPTEASQSEEVIDEFDISNEMDIEELPTLETSEVEQDPYEVEDEFNLDVFEASDEDLAEIGEAETDDIQMTREDLHENLGDHVSLDEEIEDIAPEVVEVTEELAPITLETNADGEEQDEYIFNIQETADALEMDVATIQDFVNDFIMQAKDFKPKLYEAVEHDDMIELKSLSHQLKGVAANLRIHDAQEILIQINKAEDFTYSLRDLDKFYNIISKLSGEEPEVKKTEGVKPAPVIEEPSIEEKPADIKVDIPEENENEIEVAEIDLPEIDEDSLEINDNEDVIEINDDQDVVEISEIDLPEIAEDTLEINDTEDLLEINDDEEALEIKDISEDDFDLLDEEQEELIGTNDQNDILDEIEELKPAQTYDKMGAANEIGLDEESFNELFDDFSNDSKLLISEAQEAIEADDAQKWQHAAVKLKGMSDNMRIDSFKSDIEALITLQDSSDAQKLLDKINEALLSIIETKD